jgi:hypothetical protein
MKNAKVFLFTVIAVLSVDAAYAEAAHAGPFKDLGGGFRQPEATPVVTRYGDHFYVPQWFYVNHYEFKGLRRYRGYLEPMRFYDSTKNRGTGVTFNSPPLVEFCTVPRRYNVSEVDAFLRGESNTLNGYDAPFPGVNELIWRSKDGWSQINDPETNF